MGPDKNRRRRFRAVREAIEEWFLDLHRERIVRMNREVGPPERSPKDSVTATVRAAFGQVGGSYDNPSRADLVAVMAALVEKSIAWGTPRAGLGRSTEELLALLDREAD